jgi:hypothetical protein
MPTGVVVEEAVPIEAVISASVVFPNGTQIFEVDEIFTVHSYRPGIIETTDQLAPPRGVFCASPDQTLIGLGDVPIEWPERFSVRVEASTSRSSLWQRFHLRYDLGRQRGGARYRYDYQPTGSEDYRSVIHDYAVNLIYTIDQRTGSCQTTRLANLSDVSLIRNPIEFFIKYESQLILRSNDKVWEFNGYRGKKRLVYLLSILISMLF